MIFSTYKIVQLINETGISFGIKRITLVSKLIYKYEISKVI